MKFPSFEIPKIEVPNFALNGITETLRAINNPNLDLVNAIKPAPSITERLEKMNRMRDMHNIMYEISIREAQKKAYEKRMKSITISNEIIVGIIISILIIIFSVIIPFIIVAFQNWLIEYKIIILKYLVSTFVLSMFAMIGYLLWFFIKKD